MVTNFTTFTIVYKGLLWFTWNYLTVSKQMIIIQ